MNLPNNELRKTLLAFYQNEIEEALVLSEHQNLSTLDYNSLDLKISILFQNAKNEGIEEKYIWELLHARIPTYVNYVNYKGHGKKAA